MKGISMFKIKEILRLKCEAKLSNRKIARALNISHSVVNDYVNQFNNSGREYDYFISLNDNEIKKILGLTKESKDRYPVPNWAGVHLDMRSPIVTLSLLHEEYVSSCGGDDKAYGYTWFCSEYKKYTKKLNPSMRLIHKAGEKIFIDFSGKTVPIVNPKDGVMTDVQIFVAVLPASGYPFVKAIPTQSKKDFIEAHCDMFEYFGGTSELLVPDNLKSGVTKANRYDPDINSDYAVMARHYGCAVMPTRSNKPQDKAKVEQAVKLVQRWILARLRNHTFYSIQELNVAIAKLLPIYIDKKIKALDKSRKELFEEIDKPALLPLPKNRYEYKEFKLLKVSKDYHIQLEYCYYSVPYQLIGQKVEVWYSSNTVAISHNGKEVVIHPKLLHKGAYSTLSEHMASSHKKYLEWNPGKILNWGSTIGTATAKLFKNIMDSRPHPEMGFRTCLGIMREFNRYKEKGFDEEYLEMISEIAISKRYYKVAKVKELLKTYKPISSDTPTLFALENHANIRGPEYYSE
jgi:transposase